MGERILFVDHNSILRQRDCWLHIGDVTFGDNIIAYECDIVSVMPSTTPQLSVDIVNLNVESFVPSDDTDLLISKDDANSVQSCRLIH